MPQLPRNRNLSSCPEHSRRGRTCFRLHYQHSGPQQSHRQVTKCTDRTHKKVSIYPARKSPKSEKETRNERAILGERQGNLLNRGFATKTKLEGGTMYLSE